MLSFAKLAAIAGLCATAAACQTPQQVIASKEDMLTASGFRIVPANTPERQAALANLPANKFSHQIRDGRLIYVYPDPVVCGCLYVGGQAAYGQYRQNVFQKNLADEQLMTADQNAMNGWDWGPWGGYPYPGWYY